MGGVALVNTLGREKKEPVSDRPRISIDQK
jgi:hypothetical protein